MPIKPKPEIKPLSMTLPDAIAYTGIGRSSFYNMFKAGTLKPRKLGNRTLVMVDELDAAIRKLSSAPRKPSNPTGIGGRGRKQAPAS